MPISITQENEETVLKNSSKPVILDVFATWCGPCQAMAPVFEALEKEYSGRYVFAKLNVDEARELSIKYGVSSVPTFIFFKKGSVVGKEVGSMNQEDFIEKIEQYLG